MQSVLITGANRGIGLELTRQYAHAGWTVIACCRQPGSADDLSALKNESAVEIQQLDVSDLDSIRHLADRLEHRPIDLLINNAGMFGPKAKANQDFRQSFGTMDYEIWQQIIHTNLFGPFRLVECLIANIQASETKKVANISSTVASIAGADGGIYAYRSSKVGLNIVMRSLSQELRELGVSVGIFCPGWVRTRMGGPQATVELPDAVSGIRQRIEELSLESSGRFLRYNGEVISW